MPQHADVELMIFATFYRSLTVISDHLVAHIALGNDAHYFTAFLYR